LTHAGRRSSRRSRWEPPPTAWREFFEETGWRLGDVGEPLMRSVKDVDFTIFLCDVAEEFTPRLNHEQSAYGWFDPTTVLEEAKRRRNAERDAIRHRA
jgi:hypothetical protein